MQDLRAYPFDHNIAMVPFPPRFEIPRFDKYKGHGNPEERIREFYVACMEVAYKYSYSMCLFPRSLGGQAIEWFSPLPPGINTFQEIIDQFVIHLSYNIDTNVSL